MNIFRLTGDLSHLAAIIILLLKIWKTRSCAGNLLVDPTVKMCIPALANTHLLLWIVYADVNSWFPIHLDEHANRGEMHPSDSHITYSTFVHRMLYSD
jgi:hypothetical protein